MKASPGVLQTTENRVCITDETGAILSERNAAATGESRTLTGGRSHHGQGALVGVIEAVNKSMATLLTTMNSSR